MLPMAEEGVAEAQNNVGHMYEKGLVSHKMQWLCNGIVAAEQELSEAKLNIGLLYYYGYGVVTNTESGGFRAAASELQKQSTC